MRLSNLLVFCALAAVIAGCATSPDVPVQSQEAVPPAANVPRRQTVTPEQRAKMRERREKFIAERKAKMEAQLLEVVKTSVPEEEKARALVKELETTMMMTTRRNMKLHSEKQTDSASDKKDEAVVPQVATADTEGLQQITTEERRAKMRERREKAMAERKAKMEAQLLEVVKKYVPEEEQARVLVNGLQETMVAARRNMMRRPMASAAKPDESK